MPINLQWDPQILYLPILASCKLMATYSTFDTLSSTSSWDKQKLCNWRVISKDSKNSYVLWSPCHLARVLVDQSRIHQSRILLIKGNMKSHIFGLWKSRFVMWLQSYVYPSPKTNGLYLDNFRSKLVLLPHPSSVMNECFKSMRWFSLPKV